MPLALFACAACGAPAQRAAAPTPTPTPTPATAPPSTLAPARPPTPDEARAFVEDVEDNLRKLWVMRDRANWVNENFITDDTEALSAAGEEATAAYVGDAIERSKRFDSIRAQLAPDVARKLYLLSLAQTIPAPADPRERSELAGIEAWMTGSYGKGQYCPAPGSVLFKYAAAAQAKTKSAAPCLHLEDLSRVLAKSRDFAELVEAWRGWHAIAAPMKEKYARYVELANKGAREIGFADVGALWRAGYDMPPADFEADIERLWSDVKPLYDELHCYVRARLQAKYGKDKVPDHAPIPAQLLGNMWAQEWNNLYDLGRPLPGRAGARRGQGPRGEALGRGEDGPAGRALLHRARVRPAAGDVLGALALHAPARSRRRLPRERVGRDLERRSAHQDVHRADRGGLRHHPPRARSRLLLPALRQAPHPLPAGRQRRLPRGHRRHDRAQRHARRT